MIFLNEKKKLERFGQFLTKKIDFESQKSGFSITQFRADVDLPKKKIWKNAIFHSIKLPFDAETAEKFLKVI